MAKQAECEHAWELVNSATIKHCEVLYSLTYIGERYPEEITDVNELVNTFICKKCGKIKETVHGQ